MPRTFIHTPYNVPAIFADLVRKVSVNLADDPDFTDIPQVSFKWGTWIEVMDQLVTDNKDPDKKNIKYPLVVLLQQFPEQYENEATDRINVDILICTDTDPKAMISDRYADVFVPVLNPIYAEMKQVIADSRYFLGYNTRFQHTKIDMPHMGAATNDGNTAYKLPDFLDGILMQNVSLRINDTACRQCLPMQQVEYADVFTSITCQTTGGGDILAVLALNTGGAGYTIKVDGVALTGFAINNPYGIAVDQLNDGLHILTISSSRGAEVNVEFYTINGRLAWFMNLLEQTITPALGCGESPSHTFTMTTAAEYGTDPALGSFIGQQLNYTGTEGSSTPLHSLLTTTASATGALTFPSTEFTYLIRTNSDQLLSQKSILKLKNK